MRRFSEKYNIPFRSVVALRIGFKAKLRGWYAVHHPRFKETWNRDHIKLVHLETGKIINAAINRGRAAQAKALGIGAVKFHQLLNNQRKIHQGYVTLQTYTELYPSLLQSGFAIKSCEKPPGLG